VLKSDAELIADATLQLRETRLAREPWVRQRRSQPRPPRARRTLIAFGLIAMHPGELDPLSASVRAYAHLTC